MAIRIRRDGDQTGVTISLGIVVFWIAAMLAGSHLEFVIEAFRGRIVAVHPRYVEWLIYLVVLLVAGRAVLRTHGYQRASAGHRLLLAVLVWLMLAGQVAGRGHAAYPFVTWPMYSGVSPDTTAVQFQIELASGESLDLPLRSVVPTTSPLAVRGRLAQLALGEAGTGDPADPDSMVTSRDQDWLLLLAREYARHAPEHEIAAIRVVRRALPLRDYRGQTSISDEILKVVPVGAAK